MNTLLGQRIREQRKEKGWTIEQFAERVELSANYVGDLERGVKIPPQYWVSSIRGTYHCVRHRVPALFCRTSPCTKGAGSSPPFLGISAEEC